MSTACRILEIQPEQEQALQSPERLKVVSKAMLVHLLEATLRERLQAVDLVHQVERSRELKILEDLLLDRP